MSEAAAASPDLEPPAEGLTHSKVLLILGVVVFALLLCAFICCPGWFANHDDEKEYVPLREEKPLKLKKSRTRDSLKDAASAAQDALRRDEDEAARLRRLAEEASSRGRLGAEALAAARSAAELAERNLEASRREAARRAAAYRAAMAAELALPSLSELEEGLGSVHTSVKAGIPHFKELQAARRDENGISLGVVHAPVRSPPVTARLSESQAGNPTFGWGMNSYILPSVGYHLEGLTSSRLGRLAAGMRDMLWTTPHTNNVSPPTRPLKIASWNSYRFGGAKMPALLEAAPSPTQAETDRPKAASPKPLPNYQNPTTGRINPDHAERAGSASGLIGKRSAPAAAKSGKMEKPGPSRRRAGANILGDLKLDKDSVDTLPEQIRAALHARKVRVIDLFRQLDDDLSGKISVVEFVQAMRECGLQASHDELSAVFHSFDKDHNDMIEYKELHKLLIKSAVKHPRLLPLKQKAENSIAIRSKAVKRRNANLLGGAVLDLTAENGANLDETIPNQIRAVLHTKLVRVIDLFRQLDDDDSGSISVFEFVKAMREMGLDSPPQAIVAVFKSIDKDNSGAINFKELERLIRGSMKQHPTLEEVPLRPLGAKGKLPSKDASAVAKASPDGSPQRGRIPSPSHSSSQQKASPARAAGR